MTELADVSDLKSEAPKGAWGFDSPSRHQLELLTLCWALSQCRLRTSTDSAFFPKRPDSQKNHARDRVAAILQFQ